MTRLLLVFSLAAPAAEAADLFWDHWSDGRAELSGYELVQPRYGEARKGRAVLLFVTEPYSRSRQVKVDRYDPRNPDHTTALKLNHVRKFQTGIYDYSVMTSVFVDPVRDFEPLKVTFSSQEWCGHVFEDARFTNGTKVDVDSYFEGETEVTSLPAAVPEDALLIHLRNLASLEIDQRPRTLNLLGAALHRRLKHRPARVFSTRVEWSGPEPVTVPAGTITAHAATYRRQDGSNCTVQVEAAYPHRVVGWRCTDGESAKLLGTERLPYWKTSREGQEALLGRLGLSPLRVAP